MHRSLRAASAAGVSLLLLSLQLACQSGGSEPAEEASAPTAYTTGEDCICGTERGDLIGCHCEDCLLNGGNPWNPDCTCLPLRPSEELALTYVGYTPGASGVRPRVGGNLVGLDEIKLAGQAKKLRGEVLEDDGQEIVFRDDTGAVTTYAYTDLDHRMVYRLLKAKGSKENAEDELKLASYARDCGLYAHARRHFGNVLELDAELAPEVEAGLAELRRQASEAELEKARESYAAGDATDAREHLANVLNEFPAEEAAGSASAMLGEINRQAMGHDQRAASNGLPQGVVNELVPIGEAYERASKKNEEGLRARESRSAAERAYHAAQREAEQARKELERIGSQPDAEPGTADGVRAYDALLVKLLVEVHLNLASSYLSAGDADKALAEANAALALDPDSERAREMRSRAESARDSYKEGYQQGYSQGKSSSRSLRGSYWYYGYQPGASISIGGIRGYGGWSGVSSGGLRGWGR